jgi:hypothetical protein
MAHVYADRVKETSTTTGTGTISLAGATSGFRTFVSGIGNGNTTVYAIVHQTLAEWEIGVGTVTDAATDTLSRTTILASSNANAAVNFSAGTKDVFCTMAADRAVLDDASGNAVLGTPASGTLTNCTGLPLTTGVTGTLPVANGGTGVTTSTGSGANALATSPTLVTPILGTPTSGTLTNCTGLPISTGVSGLGTGVATFLATPSSANLISAVTDETGSGSLVFGTSPTLTTPTIATIKSASATAPPTLANSSGTEYGTTCRAWVKFNGTGTVAINADFNVSSITDNGTGDYTVNFTNALADANYSAFGLTNTATADTSRPAIVIANTYSSGSLRITTTGTYNNNSNYDVSAISVSIFR